MSTVAMKKPRTLEERERLTRSCEPPLSGFTPRHVQQLAVRRKPHTMLDIECKHYLRSSTSEFTHGHWSVEYRLWLEAGKYDAPFPKRPDPNYNSNVWRNFRRQYGFDVKADGRSISEVIAAMYPLNVPPPSRVGENTFGKYITETRLFKDEKYKALAVHQTNNDLREFRRLRARSQARNPPLDEQGKILPPQNFKKYGPRFIPPAEEPTLTAPQLGRVDMFGQPVTSVPQPQPQPHLWKLTSKLNNPEYEKVQDEIDKRRKMQYKMKLMRGPVSTPQDVC